MNFHISTTQGNNEFSSGNFYITTKSLNPDLTISEKLNNLNLLHGKIPPFIFTIIFIGIINKSIPICKKIEILKEFYGKIQPSIFLSIFIGVMNENIPFNLPENQFTETQKENLESIKILINNLGLQEKISNILEQNTNEFKNISFEEYIKDRNLNIEIKNSGYVTRNYEKISYEKINEVSNFHFLIEIIKINSINFGEQIIGNLYRSNIDITIIKNDLEGNKYEINLKSYGKGVTVVQSTLSAIFELYERYYSIFRVSNFKNNSLIKLDEAIDLYNYNTLDTEDPNYTGYFLKDENGKLIDSGMVFNPLFNPYKNDNSFFGENTKGLSAGITKEGTKYQGIMELIETESIANGNYEKIDINSINDNNLKLFIDTYKPSVYKINNNFGIPVYKSLIQIKVNGRILDLSGYGADLDPKIALTRSISELAVLIETNNSENIRNIDIGNNTEKKFEDKSFSSGNIKINLNLIEEYFDKIGIKITYVDLSPNIDNLYVYRILIPGLNLY